MDFPIVHLLDEALSLDWLMSYFHPLGLRCPACQTDHTDAQVFRVNRASAVAVYRCRTCARVYHVYTGTIFAGCHLTPTQVVLLLRGVLQGQASAQLARELHLSEKTVLKWRHRIQTQAEALQPDSPLPDSTTESDEMFQNAGEKRDRTLRADRSATLPRQQTARARDVCQRSPAHSGDGGPGQRSGALAGGA